MLGRCYWNEQHVPITTSVTDIVTENSFVSLATTLRGSTGRHSVLRLIPCMLQPLFQGLSSNSQVRGESLGTRLSALVLLLLTAEERKGATTVTLNLQ